MLVLLLLNAMGYYGLFLGLEYRNEVTMIQALDQEEYDEASAITLKIPLTAPYLSDDPSFRRVNGVFEYNGEFLRLVKQRYAKDTLTIVCVKDHTNKRIHEALSEYVKTFADAPLQPSGAKLVVSMSKDYLPGEFSLAVAESGWQREINPGTYRIDLFPAFATRILHPPEA